MNKKELLDRCARDGAERILLARVLDKLELAQNRGVPAHTPFLSPGEQASVAGLLNAWGRPRHLFWGGYPDSERQICFFPAGWGSPVSCWGTSCFPSRGCARRWSCGRPSPSCCPSGRAQGGIG